MIKKQLNRVIAGENLSFNDAHQLMLMIMNGEVNNSQIASLLTALKIKGETPDEVAGFAQAMRDKSLKVKVSDSNLIDVCGTGGDSSNTFNISTTAAFVVAGAGIKVAKHGNRSISSNSGSADVLKELGININLSPGSSARAIEDIGISFLFAPDYHPAMKYVAPVRKELGMKTVFNILGPLTNPAGTKKQMIGTFDDATAKIMSEAASMLEMEKVCFICTDDKYDEILLLSETKVHEYSSQEGLRTFTLSHQTFEFPETDFREIQGESPSQNAKILQEVLSGEKKNAAYFVTVANAALGLYSADYGEDLPACAAAAEEAILSGKAMDKLEALREFGSKNS